MGLGQEIGSGSSCESSSRSLPIGSRAPASVLASPGGHLSAEASPGRLRLARRDRLELDEEAGIGELMHRDGRASGSGRVEEVVPDFDEASVVGHADQKGRDVDHVLEAETLALQGSPQVLDTALGLGADVELEPGGSALPQSSASPSIHRLEGSRSFPLPPERGRSTPHASQAKSTKYRKSRSSSQAAVRSATQPWASSGGDSSSTRQPRLARKKETARRMPGRS